MDCKDLLAVFAAFHRERIGYVAVGALARTLHGDIDLAERIEIAVDPKRVTDAQALLRKIWHRADDVDSPTIDVIWRFLPFGSPMYIDLIAASLSDLPSELLFVDGVPIRVAKDLDDMHDDAVEKSLRPSFSLRERVDVLNILVRDLLPERRIPRGVRKYRSITEADYDRHEWNAERFARLRRASASN